jgi:xanthine phosphoribosyltransferase
MVEISKDHTQILNVTISDIETALDIAIQKLKLNAQKIRTSALLEGIPLFAEILVIPRGGYIPAALLQYRNKELRGIPVTSLCLHEMSTDIYVQLQRLGPFLLIVDDIIDSGNTFEQYIHHFPYATFVAPYIKPQAKTWGHVPREFDLYGVEVPNDTWVKFPWEPALSTVSNATTTTTTEEGQLS